MLTTLVMLYINVNEVYNSIVEAIMGIIMLLAAVLLTPLYGLGYIGKDKNIITLAMILVISSGFLFLGLKFLIKNKK